MFVPIGFVLGSFFGSYLLMPRLLRRLLSRGFVVRDMYKPGTPPIATHAGILGLGLASFVLFLSFFLWPPPLLLLPGSVFGANPIVALQVGLFTICGYGIVGAVDDRRSLSHLTKAALPLTLALPVAGLAIGRIDSYEIFSLFSFASPLAVAVLLVVVPVYVLAVTNLINMHSGFNGLQSGLSLIILATLIIRLAVEGRLEDNLVFLLVSGSLAAFYPFNRIPAKAIEGNVGSFLAGATIGVGLATNGLFFAGLVMLAPHLADFVLFLYAKASGIGFVKYGTVRPDGTIEAPYPYKLKFLLPFYFRLTERQAVRSLYLLSVATCAMSFFVPF